MTSERIRSGAGLAGTLLVAAVAAAACSQQRAGNTGLQDDGGVMAAPAASPSSSGRVDVLLCDGKTTVSVPSGTPGTSIAGALMQQWMQKNPDANWAAEERERHTLEPAADNADLIGHQGVQGQTYGTVTAQEVALWKSETERVALAGSQVFHSGDELEHHRRLLRHVSPARGQHPPRDVSEVPGAARPGGAPPGHDQLVHRAPGPRQAPGVRRSEDASARILHHGAAEG